MATKKKAAKKKIAAAGLCPKPQNMQQLRDCVRAWTVKMETWAKEVKAECDRMERQCCQHPDHGPSHISDPPPPPWP